VAEPSVADGELDADEQREANALPLLTPLREALPVLLPDALAQRDADGDTDEERVFSSGVVVGANESEGLPEAEGDAETVLDASTEAVGEMDENGELVPGTLLLEGLLV
jgi:hypothetical protein